MILVSSVGDKLRCDHNPIVGLQMTDQYRLHIQFHYQEFITIATAVCQINKGFVARPPTGVNHPSYCVDNYVVLCNVVRYT